MSTALGFCCLSSIRIIENDVAELPRASSDLTSFVLLHTFLRHTRRLLQFSCHRRALLVWDYPFEQHIASSADRRI